MSQYEFARTRFKGRPRSWVVTGVAGFIGSSLLEALLRLEQRVVGLDNFSTGRRENLAQVKDAVGRERWRGFRMIDGDVCSPEACREACASAHFVLHHAALGSVPLSVDDPLAAHASNATGFMNMLVAARDAKVQRFVYASSSAVYGDHPAEVKSEHAIGEPLSPYAATKYVNELYGATFARCYGMNTIGLRYFNVFGPRQDPNGAYAAVIPQWVASMIRGDPVYINGDGLTARDFCHVEDIVQANLLAATGGTSAASCPVYNVGLGGRTTLNQLFELLRELLEPRYPHVQGLEPIYRDFRPGDVRFSEADISKARACLGFQPVWSVKDGLARTIDWYVTHLARLESARAPATPVPA